MDDLHSLSQLRDFSHEISKHGFTCPVLKRDSMLQSLIDQLIDLKLWPFLRLSMAFGLFAFQ